MIPYIDMFAGVVDVYSDDEESYYRKDEDEIDNYPDKNDTPEEYEDDGIYEVVLDEDDNTSG